MSKRYYYKPMEAAWMEYAHGFGLTRSRRQPDGTFNHSDKICPYWSIVSDQSDLMSENVRYYIHHESVELLTPRPGDLVAIGDGESAILLTNYTRFDTTYRIVERKGVAFIWPEVEEG